jgi:hypothetical protein
VPLSLCPDQAGAMLPGASPVPSGHVQGTGDLRSGYGQGPGTRYPAGRLRLRLRSVDRDHGQ